MVLRLVAGVAEQRQVVRLVRSAVGERLDVVDLKPVGASALDAAVVVSPADLGDDVPFVASGSVALPGAFGAVLPVVLGAPGAGGEVGAAGFAADAHAVKVRAPS
ncbi:MAG: hypothetical protein M0P31_09545 [Solirubrobacteraceae bacterium]|nr:hypothetical protein [Solirubrobacteraceae bacterium]